MRRDRSPATRAPRAALRRWGAAVAGTALAYWLLTLTLLDATYYGDAVTLSAREGFFAVYWGGDAEGRNTIIFNNHSWPYIPSSGAGGYWSEEQRWEIFGPSFLLSRDELLYRWRYPRRLGLYAPGMDLRVHSSYIGLPSRVPLLLGVLCIAAAAHPRRTLGLCPRCRYDLAGLAPGAPCPECGAGAAAAVPAQRSA